MKKKVKYKSEEFWVEPKSALEEKFWEDYSTNQWEGNNLEFMYSHIRGGLFLDIGAWIGPVSLLMSRFYDRVIAVDFDPVSNETFKNNIALNSITNIEHHEVGLADKETEMYIDAGSLGESTTSLFSKTNGKKLTVKVVRFNTFIKAINNFEKISFIKIDCEGAEYLFLKDVYAFIKKRKIIVHISYHPWVLKKPTYYFTKLFHWIKQLRFKRYYFSPNGSLIIKKPYSPLFSLTDRFPMADFIES